MRTEQKEFYKNLIFDNYRRNYAGLSFKQRQQLSEAWHIQYPTQRCWMGKGFDKFVSKAVTAHHISHVVELGGHGGELAQHILAEHPHLSWANYDIVLFPESHDPRRQQHHLENQLWLSNISLRGEDGLFVASDVIEHFSHHELELLFKYLAGQRMSYLALSAPLTAQGKKWRGYVGSHILTWGTTQLKQMLSQWYTLVREESSWKSLWQLRDGGIF